MLTQSEATEHSTQSEPSSEAPLSDVPNRFPVGDQRHAVNQRSLRRQPTQATLRQLGLVMLLSLLVGMLAYQAPPQGNVQVGWLGDRLFLDVSPGLGADAIERGDFYADELTPDAPTSRSRWTRAHAQLTLPHLGAHSWLDVTLLAQGWPEDVRGPSVAQPTVTLHADGIEIGSFTPTSQWEAYTFSVPADVRDTADLTLDLYSSATFTDTAAYVDPRPKGVRLAAVQVQTSDADLANINPATLRVLPPAWPAIAMLILAMVLLYSVLIRLVRGPPAFVLTILAAGLSGIGLALLRIWMGVTLQIALVLLVGLLVLTWQRPLLGLFRALVRRYGQGRALGYGLVTAALAWLGYILARISLTYQFPGLYLVREMFPDSLLYGLLGTGLLALVLVLGREGLPRLANTLVRFLGSRRGARITLLSFGGIWLLYQAMIIRTLPYVGHADYADNAVVARNLVAGRGWVVDYVTQFYQLYNGVTRPQETWPLLQPVWIAPFLAMFGEHAWAAKIPNLIFNGILLVLIFIIGTRIWDRRVGVTAVILTLTSHLFFKLTIYTTSDLAFVVFTLGAIYLLYRGGGEGQGVLLASNAQPANTAIDESPTITRTAYLRAHWRLIAAGVLTGLMMLQKPSGAMIAVGMGLWLLLQGPWTAADDNRTLPQNAERRERGSFARRLLTATRRLLQQRVIHMALLWAIPAALLLAPYLVRNLVLFGAPVFSTESYDAWVLGYRGNSEEAWEDIYQVYAPELDGPGIPDHSWILRWGFDQSLNKLWAQVTTARDYLMPAWTGAPAVLDSLVSSDGRRSLMASSDIASPTAWLAFLGVIAALRSRRRLLKLLVLAFGIYTLFLIGYWRTNEERYFVMLVPWITLLAAWMIWAGYDRLASINDGRWSPLGLLLVVVAIVSIVQPSWPPITEKVQEEPDRWAPDLAAYAWLEENTPPDAVVMTRIPWQLNWHTERPAVMIPNTADRGLLLSIARYYNAQYLVFENQLRVKGDAGRLLTPLMNPDGAEVGDTVAGFTLVYASPTLDNRVLIYQFSPTYGQEATHRPTKSVLSAVCREGYQCVS